MSPTLGLREHFVFSREFDSPQSRGGAWGAEANPGPCGALWSTSPPRADGPCSPTSVDGVCLRSRQRAGPGTQDGEQPSRGSKPCEWGQAGHGHRRDWNRARGDSSFKSRTFILPRHPTQWWHLLLEEAVWGHGTVPWSQVCERRSGFLHRGQASKQPMIVRGSR